MLHSEPGIALEEPGTGDCVQGGMGPVGPVGRPTWRTEGPVLDKPGEGAADKADCTSAGMDLEVAGNHSDTCWVGAAGSGPRASWPDPSGALASRRPGEDMAHPFVLPAA